MGGWRMSIKRILMTVGLVAAPVAAYAHPHVFAEASLEVVASNDGNVSELRNVWRFDELFSSSVLMDFDTNTDLKLDHDELLEIANTIRTSLADYDYFTFITRDGKPVEIGKPEQFHVDYQDNQLLVFFSVSPKTSLQAAGKLTFGVYDPTFYTSIDFTRDEDLRIEGPALTGCTHAVVRPDPDEIIAQNQTMLTEAFFNDPAGNDMGKLFATRLELTCG